MRRTLTLFLAGILLLLPLSVASQPGGVAIGIGIETKEVDGAPDVSGVQRIVVTNGTLTEDGVVSGKQQVTISTGGGGGGGHVIEDDGTPLTARSNLDFAGAGVTCTDNDPDTLCTINGNLVTNPTACTGTDFVLDIDQDGTLNCGNPFNTRSIEDLADVSDLRGAATGIMHTAVSETVTAGHAVCFASSGTDSSYESCGAVPGGASNVEDHASACTSGQGFLSTGSAADCADIATDAELNAIAAFGPTYQGELFIGEDSTWTPTEFDLNDGANNTVPVMLTEWDDLLGHWNIYSQGDDGSANWVNGNVACWEPEQTHRVYMNEYCAGSFNGTHSPGRPCTTSGDCGASQACNAPMWNYGASPDTITITGHDFGAVGNVWPLPFSLRRADNATPVHGGSSGYHTCSPAITGNSEMWVDVIDANTIRLHEDDGDYIAEPRSLCTATPGVPYACCTGVATGAACDDPLECTDNTTDWQSMTLEPRDATGTEFPYRYFMAHWETNHVLDASTLTQLHRCVGGAEHNSVCTSGNRWERTSCTEPAPTIVGSLGTCGAGNDGERKRVSDGSTDTDCATGSGTENHLCECQDPTWTHFGEEEACIKDTDCYGSETCTRGPCDGGGICLNVVEPIDLSFYLARGRLEAIDSNDVMWPTLRSFTLNSSSNNSSRKTKFSYTASWLVDFIPGQCLTALGYVVGPIQSHPVVGFDELAGEGGSLSISEVLRSAPERTVCNYAASATVTAACVKYGHLTNRGAGSTVTLTLPTLTAGMDFIVTNEAAQTFIVDVNGTERFLSPATNTNGDELNSDVQGDAMRVYSPAALQARVIFNSGGWYDDE